MTSIVEELYGSIEEGRKGKNKGIATGIPKMDSYTGGIQKGIYYLIFGTSGSGKTSLALYSYIYRPLKDYPDKDFLIVYFSLEMSAKALMGKLLSHYIYETYGKVISYKTLMSWDAPLSGELYNCVLESKEWLNSVMKKLIIFDKALNRDRFYSSMMGILEQYGNFEESEDGKRRIYLPDNPNKLIIGVVDHVGLAKPKTGANKKDEIDAISAYAVTFRENCGVSWIMLQQENRNSASMDRRKADLTECSPEDLKDTGNTFNDCDVCIGVYNPIKFKVKVHRGYPIIMDKMIDSDDGFIGLRDRYRALCLIKNRQGDVDKLVSVNFFGEIGLFKELPKAKEIIDFTDYLYLDIKKDEVVEDKNDNKEQQLIYNF